VLELKAPVEAMAKGLVIEAELDKGRGPVATVLVQSGTLKTATVCWPADLWPGARHADENGKSIKSAGPSYPVEIQGLTRCRRRGRVHGADRERRAREIRNLPRGQVPQHQAGQAAGRELENIFLGHLGRRKSRCCRIIVRPTCRGSQEALAQSLLKLSTDEVKVQLGVRAVGGISESDVNLAIASKAVIIASTLRADAGARKLAGEQTASTSATTTSSTTPSMS